MAEARIWGLVPAAGAGRRFGANAPKQYLPVGGHGTVLEASVHALLADSRIDCVMVVLPSGRTLPPELADSAGDRILSCAGGVTRGDSVAAGLAALREAGAADQDWVLVHDAARPGLPRNALNRLIEQVLAGADGGMLALPVPDSLKRADGEGLLLENCPREGMWLAQTPQMFRLGQLTSALDDALAAGEQPTDESAAMSRAGHSVLLVEGAPENLKITRPGDLEMLRRLLD